MSGLAHFLVSLGFTVSGSDLVANAQTARLEREGVRVMIGHSGANVGDAQKVVVNSAIPQDNPELAEAFLDGELLYLCDDMAAAMAE